AAVRDILQAGGDAEFCASNDPFDQRHCSRAPQTTDLRASEATLLADYQLANGWTLSSVSSWDWFRFRATQDDLFQLASPLLKFRDTQEADSWQQELRLTSVGGETVDWLAGLYYYRNRYDRGDDGKTPGYLYDTLSDAPLPSLLVQQLVGAPVPVPIALPGQNALYAGKQDTDYWAVFGQATWNLTPEFSITAGVRWQEEDKNASMNQQPSIPGFSLLSLALVPASIGGKLDRTTHETTWSVTPQYFFTADTNVYATVAHGFKSGGFNIQPGTTPMDGRQFQDEDIMHYEAGLKSEQFGGKLRFSLSAFFTDFKNYQDAAFIGQEFTVG
ncbi:MAG: TonB-dependent receptor, partial [Halieaceae bacterium]|nr:TonB-dependent receptor [Halieaceae bacterium]